MNGDYISLDISHNDFFIESKIKKKARTRWGSCSGTNCLTLLKFHNQSQMYEKN
jgi:hypothetical protein